MRHFSLSLWATSGYLRSCGNAAEGIGPNSRVPRSCVRDSTLSADAQREERRFANAKLLYEDKLWLTPTEKDIAATLLRRIAVATEIAIVKNKITTLETAKAAATATSDRPGPDTNRPLGLDPIYLRRIADIDKEVTELNLTLSDLKPKMLQVQHDPDRLPFDKLEVGAFGVVEMDTDSVGSHGKQNLLCGDQVIDPRI